MFREIPTITHKIVEEFYSLGGAHGKDHAIATTNLVWEISKYPEYCEFLDDRDRLLVTIAAAFHDSGYTRKPYWSGSQWEHPYESVANFLQVARTELELSSTEIAVVGYLILNHDNTNYRFPAYFLFERSRNGFTLPIGTPPGPAPGILAEAFDFSDELDNINADKLITLLQILQEADSRLGSAQRTIDFSISRGIPITVIDGNVNSVGMPMWQFSGLANVLLAGKRALLDAYTYKGKEEAWAIYQETTDFIKAILLKSGGIDAVAQFGEVSRDDIERTIWQVERDSRILSHSQITQAFALDGVSYLLGPTGEKYEISSRLLEIDDLTVKHQLDTRKIFTLEQTRELVLKNYAIDIISEITGALRVLIGGSSPTHEVTFMPPICYCNLNSVNEGKLDIHEHGEVIEVAKRSMKDKVRILQISKSNTF
jgi:hypothetical protein